MICLLLEPFLLLLLPLLHDFGTAKLSTLFIYGGADWESDMKSVITEVKEMRGELRSVKVTIDDLESSQTYLSGQMEDLLQDIKTLKSYQASLKKHVSSLEGKHDTVSSKVDQLELTAISTHAVDLGIPNKQHEVPELIINKVAAAVGIVLPDEAILEASRLVSKETSSSKTHPIKVIFSQELFTKKKQHSLLSISDVDPDASKNQYYHTKPVIYTLDNRLRGLMVTASASQAEG
ncbi:conserved hypothetical protein [Culex quinquefasciatus]|uniref:Uncharacterized protein n=1 Tax=Culex quinquefasciatus TaxID=7176 RepID=B0XGL0_CULQU|nr:conserved hypothetical protein [Culex quinquefasciatus]|eukprot:XP_001868782.1 conserved hypothetical protein [Culex quinquefasciatus]